MKKRCIPLILILLILICGVASASFSLQMVNVGAGDCFLLRSGDHFMMIDTGPSAAWPQVHSALNETGVTRLDTLVLTHFHPDHVGNLESVLQCIPVDRVLINGTGDLSLHEEIRTLLEQYGLSPESLGRGDRFSFDECEGLVLWPRKDALPEELENDHSLVMKLTFRGFSMLFTGDAEITTEQCLLAGREEYSLKADFLKAGHHGMSTSTSWRLVSEVRPDIVFISCGKQDQTATVATQTLENLREWDVSHVFSTLEYGNVLLTLEDDRTLSIR